jgi:hypothetical protein
MQDERIQTTANRFAAAGFRICYYLMCISLFYRTWILKQHIRDYWDIAAIFCIIDFRISNAIYCGRLERRCPHETVRFAESFGRKAPPGSRTAEAASLAA